MNRHCVYVRRLFYAAPFIGCCITFVTFIPRLRSALCECVFARAHFFNIASTFMREFNVLLNDIYSNLLHWKYQFSWLRLINDYVWLCICLIICLYVRMCLCIYDCERKCARVHTFMLHFLDRAQRAHIFTTISDIDIGCVEESLSSSRWFFFIPDHPSNWKQIKGHTAEN